MLSPVRRRYNKLMLIIYLQLALGAVVGFILYLEVPKNIRPPRMQAHYDLSLDVSPRRDMVVLNADGAGLRDLYIYNVKTDRAECLAETSELQEGEPSFSPDGRSIVYVSQGPGDRAGHLYLRSVSGGGFSQLTSGDYNDHQPHFAPDGQSILFVRDSDYTMGALGPSAYRHFKVEKFDLRTNAVASITMVQSESILKLTVTTDGARVIYASWAETNPQNLTLWPIDVWTAPELGFPVTPVKLTRLKNWEHLELAPRGCLGIAQASSAHSRTNPPWYLLNKKGNAVEPLVPSRLDLSNPFFGHDGNRLFFLGPGGIWQMTLNDRKLKRFIETVAFEKM